MKNKLKVNKPIPMFGSPSETRTYTTGSGIEITTNGKVVWVKVGKMTIYAEANCPTWGNRVEEFISIHGHDSEKTSVLMYGEEVVCINDKTHNFWELY